MKAKMTAEFLESERNKDNTVSKVRLLQNNYTLYAVAFDEKVMDLLDLVERMDKITLEVNTYPSVYNGKAQQKIIIENIEVA